MSQTSVRHASEDAAACASGLADSAASVGDAQTGEPLARHAGDLRRAARRRLPRAIFDYLEGGSYDELTLRANRTDLDALRLRQRTLVSVPARNRRTVIAGQEAAAPFALGPTGFAGLIHPDGEICAARAAESFGVPFCLSTFSICSIEDVERAVQDPFLFQLYMFKDRGVNEALMQRARDAGCPTLVLTVDTAVQGRRNRDLDNGLAIPLRHSLSTVLQFAARPGWVWGWARSKVVLGNLAMFVPHHYDLGDMSAWAETHRKGAVTPSDVAWVRSQWPGKLVLKGVLDAEDAKAAIGLGADGLIVSNHGGRQLDSARTPVQAFPEIREAVGDGAELYFDGGIRSGIDVLKALGLGARGCFLGRAFLYGLAAHGELGVRTALQLIAEELDAAMMLTGVGNVEAPPADLIC